MRLLVGRDPRFGQTALNALFSLGFAVLIWAAVGARLTDTQRFRVPFELRVPADVAVEYRDPYAPPGDRPFVEVLVRGPHEVLSKLNPNDIQGVRELTSLDEASLERGDEREYADIASAFRIAVKGVEVVQTTPDRLKVVLSRVGKRQFTVQADIVGQPAPHFRKSVVIVSPSEIKATGPKALLAKQQPWIKTEPVDISGAHDLIESDERVVLPDGLTTDQRVRVHVVIEPELEDREFDFPVHVLTTSQIMKPSYTFDPPVKDWHAHIMVHGPHDSLNLLDSRLAAFKELPGEPFAFVRLTDALNPGQTDAYVEIMNLPRDCTYTKTKFAYAIKEAPK